MPSRMAAVLRYLHQVADRNEGDPQSDAQLLRQFLARRDEGAFAVLLDRHGPLVLAVCRRVLRNPTDAEDAFQATFLVLARKAGSVRNPDALAAWLHRVALNLSRTTKTAAARRQAHERQAVLMSQTTAVEEGEWRDWQPLLHEEVDRLPEKYRIPIILCYFKGMTHTEAGRRLGWPLGSVKGRLARARDLLRTRLARRGLALTAGGFAAALAQSPASGNVPAALLAITLRAAASFAAGQTLAAGAASIRAVALAKGALQTMTATKLCVLLVLLTLGGLGAGLFIHGAFGKERPGELPMPAAANAAAPAPARDDFGPEVKGLRAKVTVAKEKFKAGEAIPVVYAVKNVSKEEQTLWHSGFWPNHLVLVKDADGKEPPLTEFGRQCRKAFSPGGDRFKNVAVKVPPGGEDAAYEPYDLTKLYDLAQSGRYTVQYVYEEKQGGWEGRLPSNEAAFEFDATENKDRTVEKDGVRFELLVPDAVKEKKDDQRAESKAVELNGLRFVALVPARVPKPAPGGVREFDLGLRVTNVSDKPLAISGFDVIRPRLYAADGKELGMDRGRRGLPKPPPPAMLAPAASWEWQPRAELSWTNDRATLRLGGPDGRGVAGFWSFTTLKEGKYRLAIEYANDDAKQGDVPLWTGKATTNDVEFEVVGPEAVKDAVGLIADLDSGDGAVRVAATRELLRLGREALPALEKAAAGQGAVDGKRVYLVYLLVKGLPPPANPGGLPYKPDGFGITFEKGTTEKDAAEIGKKRGFTPAGAFNPDGRPTCYVTLDKGKSLEDVLREVLTAEPKVVAANLNFVER